LFACSLLQGATESALVQLALEIRLMKISSWTKKLAAAITAGGLTTGTVAYADTSTTLTGLGSTNDNIPAGHGSNAEVTVSWSEPDPVLGDDWDQYAAWDGRGDVYQINDYTASIMFAPTAPIVKVTIDSFFLDEYVGGTDTEVAWSITGSSSGLLASGLWDDFNNANDPADAGGRTIVSPLVTGSPGETLTLLFDQSASGGYVSYLAMDNLVFMSEVVPEPASAVLGWLGVSGLGAAAMRRRRK
jgi:MYXO-CTERM domain-containing protein